MRHLPNLICLLRIALIWPIVVSLAQADYQRTLLLLFIAAASDGLDGFLAKRYHWTSELGKILDPLGDKLLLVAVFLVATWYQLIPQWLTVLAVTRDVLIGVGALVYRIGWGPLNGRPMISSKINTLLQLLYVLVLVSNKAFGLPSEGWVGALIPPICATLLLSGFLYVREFTQRALEVARA
ncbi:MAG TPA: CDP-alcohol phosphatidyltransferase family protein [Steroidobacteraceae bacterium]|jgi:cardiolipin synthase|nr:CDP-alcohol phosphatidyltransferase family protein [Steroidobacteraceae bacterium]